MGNNESCQGRTYKVRYTLEPEAGDFTRQECQEAGGGCDAFALVSMLFGSDGSYSQEVISFDGRNGGDPISDAELWKVWALIAAQLAQTESFQAKYPGKHGLVSQVHSAVREAALKLAVPVVTAESFLGRIP